MRIHDHVLITLALCGCGMHDGAIESSPRAESTEESTGVVVVDQEPVPAPAEAAPVPDRPVPQTTIVVTTEAAQKAAVARKEPPFKEGGARAHRVQSGADVAMVRPGLESPWVAPPAPPAPPVHISPPDGLVDYGINGFVDTASDALSTFAVDVDTASYTMARRSLRTGYLPPNAAVRVEEFVNYFPYRYERPAPDAPFGVDVQAAPAPFDSELTLVRVGVQGKKVSFDQRKPVNLTFLVDTSGSMRSPDKLDLVKRALVMLTEELEDGDTVAIATYAGSTRVVLPPTPVSQKRRIVGALQELTAGGSTAMASGIDLAYELAEKSYRPGTVNRVIVCSDGDANVGRTSHEEISKNIRGYAQRGITLTTLGFGNGNYRDVMMERLANDGDGNYYYIDSEREARRVLVDRLTSTLEVIARDVKIQVEWNPGAVTAYRLLGYENRDIADHDFRNDAVDAGEIGAGHQVTALYEVRLAPQPVGNLATVRIRNKAPGPDAPATERRYDVPRSVVRASFEEAGRDFRIAASAGYFAEVLRGSPHLNEVSLRQVEALARAAQRSEYGEDAELLDLVRRAAELSGEQPVAVY